MFNSFFLDFYFFLTDCRNLATQLWSRWFVKPSDPNQFGMSQDANILPDDIDLSIYAPDTSSANYADTLNINIGDEVHSISNLSTLDMASYAPYMENNDYYNVSHVEPVIPMNNNMTTDGSQAYMTSGAVSYVNEPVMQQQHQHVQQQDQQMPMHQHSVLVQAIEMNNTIKLENSHEWSNGIPAVENTIPNNAVAIPVVETPATEASSSVTLPALKIKVSKLGQQYVVNNEEVNGTASLPPPQAPLTDQADGSSKDKDTSAEKLSKDKKKEKDKKSSGSGSSSSSSSKIKSEESSKKSSDSKRREKEREKSKSSSKDGSSKSSSSKDKSKSKESDSKSKSKSSSRSESQSKEAQQAQKNLQTLATIKAMTTPTVKLAKIPRKKPEESAVGGGDAVTAATAATAAASAATDALDKLTPRPKTVKTFNSKFRSTGLVDETGKGSPVNKKLPPGSSEKKLSPSIKRPGTAEGLTQPVEKKLKPIDDTAITAAVAAVMKKTATDTKPAVKLISPRPRRKCFFFFFF